MEFKQFYFYIKMTSGAFCDKLKLFFLERGTKIRSWVSSLFVLSFFSFDTFNFE